jgi:hypothetical protein
LAYLGRYDILVGMITILPSETFILGGLSSTLLSIDKALPSLLLIIKYIAIAGGVTISTLASL